jgi:hypothetical protein
VGRLLHFYTGMRLKSHPDTFHILHLMTVLGGLKVVKKTGPVYRISCSWVSGVHFCPKHAHFVRHEESLSSFAKQLKSRPWNKKLDDVTVCLSNGTNFHKWILFHKTKIWRMDWGPPPHFPSNMLKGASVISLT